MVDLDGDAERRFTESVADHRAGRLVDAIAGYTQLLEHVADHAEALHMRGLARLQGGDPDAALIDLDRAAALQPSGPILLHRGNALRALGRLDEAEQSYDLALVHQPDLALAHTNRGNVLRDRGADALAEQAYRAALALSPVSFPPASNLAHLLASRSDADPDTVIAAFVGALDNAYIAGASPRDIAACHVGIGLAHVRRDDWAAAIVAMQAAIDADDRYANAWLGLARVHSTNAHHRDALATLERAAERCPTNARVLESLALSLRQFGRIEDARRVYARWLEIEPTHAVARHMHAALSPGPPPSGAAPEYVRAEFDTMAERFDVLLQDKLSYRAPELVVDAAKATAGEHVRARVVDLGCGTGLCGPLLRPFTRHLVGVDLSPRMLERAAARGYDERVEAEILAYCESRPPPFELAVAADVLSYFGALEHLMRGVRALLVEGGCFAFTVERVDEADAGYVLGDGGRFAHSLEYARRALEDGGFFVEHHAAAQLRTERGVPVEGWIVVARAR